nr:pantetheine-phosphate adenylyltransferase [Flavobacteriales bacterium]
MKRIAFFPGSFDPITKGHEDIVRRAIPMFDEIVVALGVNTSKNYMFTFEQRLKWVEKTFADYPTVKVVSYQGLTVDACKKHKANFILRGLRNSNDYEYEKSIALMNQAMAPDIETIYLNTRPEW